MRSFFHIGVFVLSKIASTKYTVQSNLYLDRECFLLLYRQISVHRLGKVAFEMIDVVP